MSFRKDVEDSVKKSDLDITVVRGITARALFEFIIVAIVLCGIGYGAHCHIMNMLNEALEKSVLRHVGTISHSIEHEFEQEIYEMHVGAAMVERGQVSVADLISVSNAFEGATDRSGVLRADGTAMAGSKDVLPEHEFIELADVFNGEDVIIYHKGQGLIFAVPMIVNGEPCAFYQQYADKDVPRLFSIISYDGEGRVTLGYKTGEWTEISLGKDNGAYYDKLYEVPGFREAYRDAIYVPTLEERQYVSQFEFEGVEYVIFSKMLNDDNFAIFGIVERDAVSAGIDYIHSVMLGTFGLLCLMLIMFARYTVKNVENKELQQEKILALQASQTKSEFLSNMSHEIRTPINAILGMDEMILRESKEPNTLEYAENLRHAGVSLLGIVNDILDFSKIEAGKMEIIPVEYHLSSVLNDLVNMVTTRAQKKGLQFIAKADPNVPNTLIGDEIRIKQVITNILTNAVKYTETGSVTLTVTSRQTEDFSPSGVGGREDKKNLPEKAETIHLCVSVSDTGIGIKEEDISKLFSAFERIEEKRNRTIEGTGLGMNITQQLLHLMGSELRVESVYGQGSTFSFELEQKVVSREPIGDFEESFRNSLKQHKEYHEKFTAPDACILVVDDTVMNLTVVKGLLKQTKIQIETAESGYDCLDLVMKKKYDVIFLDHRMPGMDGIETLHEMKMRPNNPNEETPVISLTANAISGAKETYLAAGFQDYLTKPINSAHLENMLIKYLPPEKILAAQEGKGMREQGTEDQNSSSLIPQNSSLLPEWLTEVKGLNVKEGIEHCGGVEEYLEVLKIFVSSVSDGAEEIEDYFNSEDWKNYTTKVHALKSSSRVIGANELSDRARRLEDAGNSGYIDEIKQDTAAMLKLYRSYGDQLLRVVGGREGPQEKEEDKPPIDDTELQEAFSAMKDIAATFDYDSLMFIFQSLDEYKLPDTEAERYKQIKAAASKLDWETINKLLN